MGLFDWVETGFAGENESSGGTNAAAAAFEELFKGSFSVTLGDVLNSIVVGGQHTHVYGDSFQFTLDWESLLEGLLGKIPGVGTLFHGVQGALINGAGGYTNLIYGHNAGLVFGENIDVKRAVSATSSGKNYLYDWFTAHQGFAASELKSPAGANPAQQKEVDDICGVISGILSALMVCASLALELVAAFKYPTGDPMEGLQDKLQEMSTESNPQNPYEQMSEAMETPEGPQRMQTLLKTLSWTISSRLAALVIQVELIGQATRDANKNLWICEKLAAAAAEVRTWPQSVSDWWARGAAGRQRAADAVSEYKWVIVGVTVLIGLLAAAILIGASVIKA